MHTQFRSFHLLLLASLTTAGALIACGTDERQDDPGENVTGGGENGGSGGSGGSPNAECSPSAGGAIGYPGCFDWLGGDIYSNLDRPLASCAAQGGMGGTGFEGAGDEPVSAVYRSCASGLGTFADQALSACVGGLAGRGCDADVEQGLIGCINRARPFVLCPATLSGMLESAGCTQLMEACPAITAGSCFFGMRGDYKEQVTSCMSDTVRDGESCDRRFFRCAWGF